MNYWIPNSECRWPDICAKWATHVSICPRSTTKLWLLFSQLNCFSFHFLQNLQNLKRIARCNQGASAREGSSSGSFNLPSLSIGGIFSKGFHRQQKALHSGAVPLKSGLVAGGISVNEAEEACAYMLQHCLCVAV